MIDAHMVAMGHTANPPALYNVGTGNGVSVREFVEACKKVTGVSIKVRKGRWGAGGRGVKVGGGGVQLWLCGGMSACKVRTVQLGAGGQGG